jgi:tetratricopeptide (TPR) repeat protein
VVLGALALAPWAGPGPVGSRSAHAEPGGDPDEFWGELAQPGFRRYRFHLEAGRRLAAQEPPRLPLAIRAFELAVALLPARPEAHLELGRAFHRSERCVGAVPHLERALAAGLGPFEARGALILLGDCRRRRGDFASALHSYQEALERVLAARRQAHTEALRQARIEVARGWRPASRPVAQNPALDTEELELRRRLGDTLVSLGRLSDAEASYRDALGIEGRHALSWLGLGVTLMLKERVVEGEEALRRALQAETSERRLVGGGGVLDGEAVQKPLLHGLLALAADRLGEAVATLRPLVDPAQSGPYGVQLRALVADLEVRQKAVSTERKPAGPPRARAATARKQVAKPR